MTEAPAAQVAVPVKGPQAPLEVCSAPLKAATPLVVAALAVDAAPAVRIAASTVAATSILTAAAADSAAIAVVISVLADKNISLPPVSHWLLASALGSCMLRG